MQRRGNHWEFGLISDTQKNSSPRVRWSWFFRCSNANSIYLANTMATCAVKDETTSRCGYCWLIMLPNGEAPPQLSYVHRFIIKCLNFCLDNWTTICEIPENPVSSCQEQHEVVAVDFSVPAESEITEQPRNETAAYAPAIRVIYSGFSVEIQNTAASETIRNTITALRQLC